MADTFTHGAVTGWAAKFVGGVVSVTTGIELFDADWLLTAVFGAILLDMCTDPLIWVERHLRFGHNRSFFISMKYNRLLSQELATLETEGAYTVAWYNLVHTYWVAAATTIIVSLIFGPYLASAWACGYFPHVALDEGTHRKLTPFLPFKIRCFNTDMNWWEWRWQIALPSQDVTIAWNPHIYCVSVPAAFVGVYHILQLYSIAP